MEIVENKGRQTGKTAKEKQKKETMKRLSFFIEMLEGTVENYKPSFIGKNKRVLMLERTGFTIETLENKGIGINTELKPQLFSIQKANKIKEQAKKGTDEKILIVTKLAYLKQRLKFAKGALDLLERAENEEV